MAHIFSYMPFIRRFALGTLFDQIYSQCCSSKSYGFILNNSPIKPPIAPKALLAEREAQYLYMCVALLPELIQLSAWSYCFRRVHLWYVC